MTPGFKANCQWLVSLYSQLGPVASCWWIWRISPTVYYPAISIHPIFQYQHLPSSSFSQIWNNGGLHVCHVPSTMGTGWIIVNHRDGWKLKPMMHFLGWTSINMHNKFNYCDNLVQRFFNHRIKTTYIYTCLLYSIYNTSPNWLMRIQTSQIAILDMMINYWI